MGCHEGEIHSANHPPPYRLHVCVSLRKGVGPISDTDTGRRIQVRYVSPRRRVAGVSHGKSLRSFDFGYLPSRRVTPGTTHLSSFGYLHTLRCPLFVAAVKVNT